MFGEELKNYFGGANDIYDDGLGPVSGKEIANLLLANLDLSFDSSTSTNMAMSFN